MSSFCLVHMNVIAKFDQIPSMTLQDIKETKRFGHTFVRTDNVKTVYPPTNTVCGGYNNTCVSAYMNFKIGTVGRKIFLFLLKFLHGDDRETK